MYIHKQDNLSIIIITSTVEPPNSGLVGAGGFVRYSESFIGRLYRIRLVCDEYTCSHGLWEQINTQIDKINIIIIRYNT